MQRSQEMISSLQNNKDPRATLPNQAGQAASVTTSTSGAGQPATKCRWFSLSAGDRPSHIAQQGEATTDPVSTGPVSAAKAALAASGTMDSKQYQGKAWKATTECIDNWRNTVRQSTEPVEFLIGGEALTRLLSDLRGEPTDVRVLLYSYDHSEINTDLVRLVSSQKVKVKMMLDETQFMYPGCERQAKRVAELWRAGCQIKTYKPKGPGHGSQHAKTWIFGEEVVYAGSANGTHCAYERNEDQVIRTTFPTAVQRAYGRFEELWRDTTSGRTLEVTQERIAEMLQNQALKDADKLRRSDADEGPLGLTADAVHGRPIGSAGRRRQARALSVGSKKQLSRRGSAP